MRIAIMGTGGVGGYFGARLAQGGHDVAFVARGKQLEALRADGLRVLSSRGDVHLPEVVATDDPSTLEPVDIVLFSVKLWDTEDAAERIRPLLGADTGVISFQNSVVKDDILRRVLGERHMVGGACNIAAVIEAPGVIRQTGAFATLMFGEYDGTRSPRVERFAAACADGGIDAEVSDDIVRTIWQKFVFLVAMSGTTTLARSTIGPLRTNPRSRAFIRDVIDEAVRIGLAEGVNLAEDFADDRLAFIDGLPEAMTSSMHHDLERGNRLEVPWLSGDVVARGERLGIPTPANRAIADLLAVHAEGRH